MRGPAWLWYAMWALVRAWCSLSKVTAWSEAPPHAGSLAACSAMANIIYGDLADGGGVPTAMREFNFQTLRLIRGGLHRSAPCYGLLHLTGRGCVRAALDRRRQCATAPVPGRATADGTRHLGRAEPRACPALQLVPP